jgi:hypothetical protein
MVKSKLKLGLKRLVHVRFNYAPKIFQIFFVPWNEISVVKFQHSKAPQSTPSDASVGAGR